MLAAWLSWSMSLQQLKWNYVGKAIRKNNQINIVMKRIFWSKYRILLLLLGMTAALYILFLYYSMTKLDAVNSNSFSLERGNIVKEEILQDKIPKMPEFSVVARMQQSRLNPKTLIRGVFLDKMHLYLPIQNNTFQCLHTKQHIPYQYLNDDFCDCNDNSDEPGTSACHSSRFYCTFQLEGLKPQFTWSSRVQDGICDCCDGSDEWSTEVLPDKIRIKDPALGGAVMHAPCANWCITILQKVRRKKMLTKEGRKHKAPYLEAAVNVKNKKNYGPEGVFYKLSLECFQILIPPYDYNICPFKKCTQQKFPQPMISLGQKPIWEKMRPGSYVLKMTGGSAQYCPDNKERLSRITFECGVVDKVKSIQEDVCEYGIIFSTPAAC